MQKQTKKLEEKIGYTFRKKELLEQALTHPSCGRDFSYERLEFLGDLVLDAVVGISLFKKHPDVEESYLTDLKAAYVNSSYLQDVGLTMRMDRYIKHENNGVPKLDNFLEALIGAMYIDSGWRCAEQFIKKFILHREIMPMKNYKNLLLSLAVKKFGQEPQYKIEGEHGPPHDRKYSVKVKIPGRKYVGRGRGKSKKDAEKQAAEELLGKFMKKAKGNS